MWKSQKRKEKQEKKLKIINYRDAYTNIMMEKNRKRGEVLRLLEGERDWRVVHRRRPTPNGLNKFQAHHFKLNMLFVCLKKDTPLKSFTVYDGFSHWCSCGLIDMNKEYFISHVKLQHQGIIPKESQLNQPYGSIGSGTRTMS